MNIPLIFLFTCSCVHVEMIRMDEFPFSTPAPLQNCSHAAPVAHHRFPALSQLTLFLGAILIALMHDGTTLDTVEMLAGRSQVLRTLL